MRQIGLSTGALAKGDFRSALRVLRDHHITVVELSALREEEMIPLVVSLPSLDLTGYSYISLHAPSRLNADFEETVISHLRTVAQRGIPIVVHPDAIHQITRWQCFNELLLIENMDKRKPIGRTAQELRLIFSALPDARLCFDIGHARQVDPTMTEAGIILREFGSKLHQIHLSQVSTKSTHERLSLAAVLAFQQVCHLIPENVPVILETPTSEMELADAISEARRALSAREQVVYNA